MELKDIHLPEVRNIYVSPKVDFNSETGVCEISGESFLEETAKFYLPLIEWIQQYIKTGKPIVFNIKLTYFNTSSSKWLLRILYLLSEYQKEGKVTVNWYIYKDDLDLLEDIEDFTSDIGLKVNIKYFDNAKEEKNQGGAQNKDN